MAGTIKMFCIYRKKILLHRIKSIYCSLHETWLPCKTSIALKLSPFWNKLYKHRQKSTAAEIWNLVFQASYMNVSF